MKTQTGPHCVKGVHNGVFSGPYFTPFKLNTARYFVSLHIQSKCRKMRTRKNFFFRHFSRSAKWKPSLDHCYYFFLFCMFCIFDCYIWISDFSIDFLNTIFNIWILNCWRVFCSFENSAVITLINQSTNALIKKCFINRFLPNLQKILRNPWKQQKSLKNIFEWTHF